MKGLEAFLELKKLDLGKPLQNAGNPEIYRKMLLVKKELKAYDIIKEKGVDVGFIKTCKDVKEYNYYCYGEETNKKLTEEEFNFVMEMLEND